MGVQFVPSLTPGSGSQVDRDQIEASLAASLAAASVIVRKSLG